MQNLPPPANNQTHEDPPFDYADEKVLEGIPPPQLPRNQSMTQNE